MAFLYVVDSSTSLGLRQGQVVIKNPAVDHDREIPLASVDGISVFGMAQLSTQLIRTCLTEHISIGYYTDDGHYIGKTSSFDSLDPIRQKHQMMLTDNDEFCLGWSKKIVSAKIHNSLKLLTAVCNGCKEDARSKCPLHRSLHNIEHAETIEVCIGYEGDAAKRYFRCLNNLIQIAEFRFSGRSSRPPRDAFNAMLSYGYSLLYRNIVGSIERHGLHPYFGFMHRLRHGHAALASDLIEECRAPLVDKTIVDIVNAGGVSIDGFYKNSNGAVYMDKDTARRVTNELSSALVKKRTYFASADDTRRYGFQVMLDMKLMSTIEAIERKDIGYYKPFIWEVARMT